MRIAFKALLVLACLLIVGAIAGIVMLVASRYASDDYTARVKIAFNAATLNYAPGDAATTVRAEIGGAKYELNPENYRVLSFYMCQNAGKNYLPRRKDDNERIVVTLCDTDTARIYRINQDTALVEFESGGETMKMRISGDGLWSDLTGIVTYGRAERENTPL